MGRGWWWLRWRRVVVEMWLGYGYFGVVGIFW